MKRLFIALTPNQDILNPLSEFMQPYKTHQALKSAKWVSEENQHVTALFLGEVADAVLPEIRELTRGVCGRMSPFNLEWEGVALFPPRGHSKMLWLRGKRSLAFEEFVNELKRFLVPVLGGLEEEKEPLPHLTLARLREAVEVKTLSFKPITLPPLRATSATLFESELRPEGPVYTALEVFSYAS